jgi:uncharacterized Ntn-hydrolase superfamily protein
VGAVATQANVEISYGPRALALMEDGANASEALERLLREDAGRAGRQVAVIDAGGQVAAHTGEECIAFAGHVTGDGVSCQANIMASERVWPSMLEAYKATQGTLTVRLLAALDAAEREGGDIRGRQSAAILVVPASGEPWRSVVALRVEDNPQPLPELRRLVKLHEAYTLAGRGDALINEARHEEAGEFFQRASALAPENHELRFWAGLGLAQAGDLAAGVEKVRQAVAEHAAWRVLLDRLTPEFAPSAEAVRARLSETGE